jgi:hypothetical protein
MTGPRNYLSYVDGLGDRDRSLRFVTTPLLLASMLTDDSPDPTPSWAALLPDDLGFATACDLWDEEDAELLGLGLGLGAGGIEEALIEFRRRREEREEQDENGEARREAYAVLERVGAASAAAGRLATGTRL